MGPKQTASDAAQNPQHAAGVHAQRPVPAPQPAAPVAATGVQPAPSQSPQQGLYLPPQVVSRSDVSRCLRELQALEEYLHQAAIRGSKVEQLPRVSMVLEALARANGINLLHAEGRDRLKPFLAQVKSKGPVVHMSFPSTASSQFTARLLDWFRKETHPHVMLHIGLQPELAAGFTVRTTNKAFDFSFRKRFEQSKQKLIGVLEDMDKLPEKVVVAGSTDTVAPENQL